MCVWTFSKIHFPLHSKNFQPTNIYISIRIPKKINLSFFSSFCVFNPPDRREFIISSSPFLPPTPLRMYDMRCVLKWVKGSLYDYSHWSPLWISEMAIKTNTQDMRKPLKCKFCCFRVFRFWLEPRTESRSRSPQRWTDDFLNVTELINSAPKHSQELRQPTTWIISLRSVFKALATAAFANTTNPDFRHLKGHSLHRLRSSEIVCMDVTRRSDLSAGQPFSVKYWPAIKFIKSLNAIRSDSDDTNEADGLAGAGRRNIAYYARAHKFIDISKSLPPLSCAVHWLLRFSFSLLMCLPLPSPRPLSLACSLVPFSKTM